MKDYGSNRNPSSPYQCFMGRWEGLCETFSPTGEFIEAGAVHMDVYWVDEHTWHLHEDFENFYGLGKAVTFHSDITVNGKFCSGESELVKLEGTELTPFNYVFTIWSAVSQTTVYNNHYFLDPNNRRILTHKVRDGKTNIFQIQDFVRVLRP
ncbi:MAG: hypothetical protein JNL09_06270 [Anaerolineales bacterium]|nr:hypothetical protein [Anaerolineales bacterium]